MPDNDSKPGYYIADIGPRLKPNVIDLFRKWTGLSGDALLSHLHGIVSFRVPQSICSALTVHSQRDRAWLIAPYPCVGSWFFLFPGITRLPQYPSILDRARNGALILDLGCCFGQDLRLLAADGVPMDRMIASDLEADLWELGFELFRDQERMHAQFIQADACASKSQLDSLGGKIGIILACQFLHIWDWEKQFAAMKRIVRLSKVGTVVIGYQRGREERMSVLKPWANQFIHDLDSFQDIWCKLGEATETSWLVEAKLTEMEAWGMEPEDKVWMDQPPKGIDFLITREK